MPWWASSKQPSRRPRELPCKYFYDAAGSALFERICELEEYYPTRTELSILEAHASEMAELLGERCLVIEPGSSTLVERTITTGLANWQYTEVTEGLKEGEQVVTSVQREGVKAGARVTVAANTP